MGKVFNAKPNKEDKTEKVGILQRLKNIEKKFNENKTNNKPFTGEIDKEDLPEQHILGKYNVKNLKTTSKRRNPEVPRQIDGKSVHDVYKKLIKDEISKGEFFTIFNPFSNDTDRVVRVRGKNLGSVQRTLKELRDDLRSEIMPPLENDQTGL